jgi:hypothetical protein
MNTKMKACQNNSSNSWSLNNFTPLSLVIPTLVWVSTIGSLGLAASVHADTLYADALYATSFEQPTFLPGDQLLGLDGWSTAGPPFLNPAAAVITNAVAKRGIQSVEVSGAAMLSAVQVTPYDAAGVYRRPLNGGDGFDTALGDKKWVRVDADLMLKTPKPKTPGQFFSLTLSARAGDGSLGEIGLSSQGVVEAFAYDADAIPGGPPLANCKRGIRFNKWHHITLLHDFTRHITSYFIDEHFLCATPAPRTSTVLLRGAMGVFARPDGGDAGGVGSVRSDYTARFDNFRVSVHSFAPEID